MNSITRKEFDEVVKQFQNIADLVAKTLHRVDDDFLKPIIDNPDTSKADRARAVIEEGKLLSFASKLPDTVKTFSDFGDLIK